MPNYVYPAIGLIGGTAGFLDAIDGTSLADKDMAIVSVQGDKTYFYVLDVDSAAAEASPGIIAPDANGGDKRWILTGFTPVSAATGWTGAGGTTSKTLTVSSDADTKDIIKGDGTAGRVIRTSYVLVSNGTEAAHIKCTLVNVWNGDAAAEQDNIGKDGVLTGIWTLSASGSQLTLDASGITGNGVAVLAISVFYNSTGTVLNIYPTMVDAPHIKFDVRNASSGAVVDMALLADTGDFYIYFTYLTSA